MNLKIESYRKFLHFLLIIIPIFYILFGAKITTIILAPITVLITSLDYLRRKNLKINLFFNRFFGLILRESEKTGEKLSGASFVFLGATINFLFFKPAIAVCGFTILVISDGLAALVGKAYPSRAFFEKTFSGSLAFFVSALLVLIICALSFEMSFWFYFFGFFTVACLTIIEARPSLFKIDDNFLIPIFFAIEMSFFDILWNYNY
jgi:dolichol kinase